MSGDRNVGKVLQVSPRVRGHTLFCIVVETSFNMCQFRIDQPRSFVSLHMQPAWLRLMRLQNSL